MIDWFDFVVAVPATWYLQWLIVDADIIAEPREWLIEKLVDRYERFPARKALQFLGCGLCVAFWAALGLRAIPEFVLWGFGVAGSVLMLKRFAARKGVDV